MALRGVAQRIARSPVWRVLRFVLVAIGFLLTWTGWTGPELLDRLGGDFFQSDAFRTVLVLVGLALVIIVVLIPAPFRPEEWVVTYEGGLVRRVAPGYKARCEWKDGRWLLTLKRPSEKPARFDVKVRHREMGTAHHEEFQENGQTVTVEYPGDFKVSAMPDPPWGEYLVFWAVIHPDGRRDSVETAFTWTENEPV